MKRKNDVGTLCYGLPNQFSKFLDYTRNGIDYHEKPDYEYLRSLLIQCFHEQKYNNDNCYDWNLICM